MSVGLFYTDNQFSFSTILFNQTATRMLKNSSASWTLGTTLGTLALNFSLKIWIVFNTPEVVYQRLAFKFQHTWCFESLYHINTFCTIDIFIYIVLCLFVNVRK
jgi:hypothetical protein